MEPPRHPVIQAEVSKGWRMQICGTSHPKKSTRVALRACAYLSFPFCGGFLPQFPYLQRVMAMQDLLRMAPEFGPGGMSHAEPSVSPELSAFLTPSSSSPSFPIHQPRWSLACSHCPGHLHRPFAHGASPAWNQADATP